LITRATWSISFLLGRKRFSWPVTMQSSRRDESGSWYSRITPWSSSSASRNTIAVARSEFCHDCTSFGDGL